MKRSELEGLGLEKEVIDKIMDINGKDIESAKASTENLKKENENLSSQLKERDKQIDSLRKSAGDNESLTKQIEELQNANKESAKKYDEEIKQLKLDAAIDSALTGAKARNVTAVKALLTDLKLNDDGTVTGLEEQVKALKSSKDTSFLFEPEQKGTQLKGVKPDDSNTNTGTQGVTKEQFNKMGYMDRISLRAKDPDLYNELSGHNNTETK